MTEHERRVKAEQRERFDFAVIANWLRLKVSLTELLLSLVISSARRNALRNSSRGKMIRSWASGGMTCL